MPNSVRNSTGHAYASRALTWIGAHDLGVLIALAVAAAGIWLFIGIAGEMMEGETQGLDRTILLAMRRPGDLSPRGPAALQDAARDVTALGGVVALSLLTLATTIFLVLDERRHMAIFLLGSVTSGLVISTILKDFFHRPRPELVPHAAYVATASFPSGHSMMSAITYFTLAALLSRSQQRRSLKAFFLLVALTITSLVGLSRVYLGVHWPSDVLAGWAAGGAWASLCWVAARRLQGSNTLERETGLIDISAGPVPPKVT